MNGATSKFTTVGLLLVLCAAGVSTTLTTTLDVNYYSGQGHFCPAALPAISAIVSASVFVDPTVAAKLLRLHFHDCWVNGCDGSVLISSTTKNAEKDADANLSLGGFDVIDLCKAAVEIICPRTVSCADIVALAARDAVATLAGTMGPQVSWNVELGRKDGNISIKTQADAQLPAPSWTLAQLIANFASKGLDLEDLVVLSGAHTIGVANCTNDNTRLYNFGGHGGTDPNLNASYASFLKAECPPNITTKMVHMKDDLDSRTSNNLVFDNQYYVNVVEKKGFFTSDSQLLASADSIALTNEYAGNNTDWLDDFKTSMVNLGRVDVKTTGYVRKNCRVAFS